MNGAPIPTLAEIEQARDRIRGAAIRTPLVRLNVPAAPDEIWLKLENLQPIGSFKIRGAANAMGRLPAEELARGVLTASAGNMAQGVAWCARARGIRARWSRPWETFESRRFPGVDATFVHAFDDPHVMAGNGTIGLEILEDLPEVAAIVVPWGGGGLTCGIAAAVRALKPGCRILAAEVETAAPLSPSLAAGEPRSVEYRPSFVDGIGSRTVFASMLERTRALADGAIVATLGEVAAAVGLLAERNRIVAEGAGACSVACALTGRVGAGGAGPIVCVVSGGNIDLDRFASLVAPRPAGT